MVLSSLTVGASPTPRSHPGKDKDMLKSASMLKASLVCCLAALSANTAPAVAGPPGAPNGTPAQAAEAGPKKEKKEFPPFEKVTEGLEKVVSTTDGADPLYDLYRDKEAGKLLGVVSAGYDKKLLMIACTVSGGDRQDVSLNRSVLPCSLYSRNSN